QDSRGGKRREHAEGLREPYQKGPRDDFGASVWFSISVGRKQNAEPRWLIPMLCRNGNLTKREIGAIKMQPEETYVEISAASADSFLQSIGPNKTMERGIRVTPLNGTPDFSKPAAAKPYAGKKTFGERREFTDERPKGNFRKEARGEGGSDERRDSKPWGKKPGKPKFEGKGGSGPKPKFSKK
ncbi:MAG: DbpA RNA binding domain-containing protein, partial [Rhizobium altiplani]|uniref:DbpA RNA binding domain-containing protein n=1 Tax=Rhizobium altiplani TaxID=1864509 RepID=UPI0030F0EC9E